MKIDENEIFKDIAGRRDMPEGKAIYKQTSPTNKYALIGGIGAVTVALIGIYAVSRPTETSRQVKDPNQQILARLIPQEEVTPEYIDTVGNKSSALMEKADAKPRVQEEANQELGRPPRDLREPTQVSSMMIYTAESIAGQLGRLGVPLGTEIQAVLEKTVIADDRAVPVIARITEGYEKDGKAIIPRNSRLFGTTQGMMENRVEVRFSRIVFPDGKEYAFSGVALDTRGGGGIPGDLNRKGMRRGQNLLTRALIGASGVFTPGGSGFADSAVRGAHGGAAGELMQDNQFYRRTSAMPTVTIKANTGLTVLVDRAV